MCHSSLFHEPSVRIDNNRFTPIDRGNSLNHWPKLGGELNITQFQYQGQIVVPAESIYAVFEAFRGNAVQSLWTLG
jgi:hypothetical protein